MSVQTLPPCPHGTGAPQGSPPDGRSHRLDFDPPEERRSLLPLLAMMALSWLLILAMGLVITGTMR